MKIYTSLKFLIIIIVFFASSTSSIAQSKSSTKQLSDIKQAMRVKEIEKDKLILQERIYQKELKSINETLKQTEKKIKKVSKDIECTTINFKKTAKNYDSASLRKSNWYKTVLDEFNFFHKMTFLKSYLKNPVEYKLMRKSLEFGKSNFEKEKKSAENLAFDMKKLEETKKNLTTIKQKENSFVIKNKNLLEVKNKTLQTTAEKRQRAEKELRALNDSAKALQALINRINAENIKKQKTTIGPVTLPIKKKKSLPWPVKGKVISYFGKTKHPELDTYVVNNGIKVKTSDHAKIKSIDSGKVIYAGDYYSYGKIVIIDHRNSTVSVYGLLNKILVKKDQELAKETTIAELDLGKNAVLYFEIRQNNIPDNPLLWLCDNK